uniref:Uncharacterized protein n=1 Tax=Anopheles minimus TaxID=112268 RepID=A0A182VTY1_9DIPT
MIASIEAIGVVDSLEDIILVGLLEDMLVVPSLEVLRVVASLEDDAVVDSLVTDALAVDPPLLVVGLLEDMVVIVSLAVDVGESVNIVNPDAKADIGGSSINGFVKELVGFNDYVQNQHQVVRTAIIIIFTLIRSDWSSSLCATEQNRNKKLD